MNIEAEEEEEKEEDDYRDREEENMLDDPFRSSNSPLESFSIIKDGSVYQFMAPQKFVSSPTKPGIQINDEEKLNAHFVTQLSSGANDNNCSTATTELFNNHKTSRQKKEEIFDNTISITKDFKNNKYIKYIKHAVLHYCDILERIKLFPKDDERTFFVEGIQPFFTKFGAYTKLLSFQWCEKQLRKNHVWYINNDYSTGDIGKKFLDGIGSFSEFNLPII